MYPMKILCGRLQNLKTLKSEKEIFACVGRKYEIAAKKEKSCYHVSFVGKNSVTENLWS